jgi:protein-tyrosine phosphatase
MNVLFVCYGNICRSPTAEGVFATLTQQEGLADRVRVSSAGTSSTHVGEAPDERTQDYAKRRGYPLNHVRAQQISPDMIAKADFILAMDRANVDAITRVCPPEHQAKIQLFLEYAPDQPVREVPDPYYGGGAGFEHVLDLAEVASRGLLKYLRTRLGL